MANHAFRRFLHISVHAVSTICAIFALEGAPPIEAVRGHLFVEFVIAPLLARLAVTIFDA